MRRARLASGLRPFTKVERRRITHLNARAELPDLIYQKYEATCRALEAKLARQRSPRTPVTASLPRTERLVEQRADAYGEVSR